MRQDTKKVAIEYYFGDLQYWRLPQIAADALEEGYTGLHCGGSQSLLTR